MNSRSKTWLIAITAATMFGFGGSMAQAMDARIPLLRARVEVLLDTPMTPLTLAPVAERRTTGFDYMTFASELTAYVAKEVISDSPDEFSESRIRGPLSASMPDSHSRFGTHCLVVVSQLGDTLGDTMPTLGASSSRSNWAAEGAGLAARGIGTAFAIHEMWKGVRREISGDTDGLSIHPKVGANKLAIAFTFRW